MSAPDTAAAMCSDDSREIELCVYENDEEEPFMLRTFRLSRSAAQTLRMDLARALAEQDEAFKPRQESLL